MRSNDYIDFMKSLEPDERLEERLLDAAENGVKPRKIADDDGMRVSGVEEYRKPVWIGRVSAAAAAVVIVAAMGTGIHGMMKNTVGQSSLTEVSQPDESDIPEVIPTEPPTEPPVVYPENTYDMTTKEGILAKMLNSVDFYERASGTCVLLPFTSAQVADIVEFSYDMTKEIHRIKDTSLNLSNTYDDIAMGQFPEGWEGSKYGSYDVYRDGEFLYYADPEGYTGMYEKRSISDVYGDLYSEQKTETINAAEAVALVREEVAEEIADGYNEALYTPFRMRRKGCPLNVNFADKILKCLYDFDTWDFERDQYAGREALCITGKISEMKVKAYPDYHLVTGCDFVMYADVETGMMLKYVEYNTDGSVYDVFVVHDIHFDDDAAPVEVYDIEGRTEFNHQAAWEGEYGYPKNSKGETYGCGSGPINAENRANLPDLVTYGQGYAYTDDIIAEMGDYCNISFTHCIRRGNEMPKYKLNIYTSEGEFIETLYYYDGYIDE